MLSMFVFIFGAFAAAQSISMGPDVKKATKAAMKIFHIMRTPSKVDTGKAELQFTKKLVKFQLETEGKNKGLPRVDRDGNRVLYEGTERFGDYVDGVVYES